MEVDETWCFLGDAAYATQKNGQTVYNAERLLAEIPVLKNVRAPHFFLSHSEPFQQNKEDVLEWMEAIYEKRKRDESYIKKHPSAYDRESFEAESVMPLRQFTFFHRN